MSCLHVWGRAWEADLVDGWPSMRDAGSLRGRLRQELSGRLQRSPMDFIWGFDPTGDREVWLEELTRPLPPEHDLTLVIASGEAGRVAVFAEILPWDTEFFGLSVARLNAIIPVEDPGYQVAADLGPAVDGLVKLCAARQVQYLFAPVDMRDVAVARALSARGFELIESRVYGHRSLEDFDPPERFAVRLATPDDVAGLSKVAASMVNPYDRFHADPVFRGERADRLMREWVRASVCGGFADGAMVPDVEDPRAFLTIKSHRERWSRWGRSIGQAPFGAVDRSFRGWYVKLISEICLHLRSNGAEHFFMVSQATNNAVVRCWEKLGIRYGKNEVILRRCLQ